MTYLEPVAAVLSKKSGLPVRLQMTREDVFRASGPTSGVVDVGEDRRQEGRHDRRRRRHLQVPGRRLPGLAGDERLPVRLRAVRHRRTSARSATTWCRNRPKAAAYRAPGSPISAFAVESVLDMCAKEIGMDPLELRHKNACRIGTPTISGPKHAHAGYIETLEALMNHPAYKAKLGPNQGRGVASGYWFNGGGESSATLQVNADGTVLVATGSPDIGGSRASMAMMAAETLGVDYNTVRAIVADTASIGYTHVTGGSRVTFATGMAVVNGAKNVVKELCKRAAMIWDVDAEGVVWEDGHAKPAGVQRRRLQAAVVDGDRGEGGGDRRADHRVGRRQRRRPGARLLHAVLRRGGRSGDRARSPSCASSPPRTSARRSTRATSRARSRAASCRASAGR